MPQVPNKVAERLAAGIKRFQPIFASAKSRDVGESDTVHHNGYAVRSIWLRQVF
jgi:hypothetical protein